MSNACSRVSSQRLMSGEWHYHMSIIHTILPCGLHRDFYIINFDEETSTKVKHRVNKHLTSKKNVWRDLRCAYV